MANDTPGKSLLLTRHHVCDLYVAGGPDSLHANPRRWGTGALLGYGARPDGETKPFPEISTRIST